MRHLFFFCNAKFAVVLRKALTSILYHKLLRLSQSSISEASAGKLINIASGDMAVIERGVIFLPYLLVSPVSSVVTLTMTYLIVRSITY